MYRVLDLSCYPRADHFRYFCSLANPFAGVTVPVDVTELVAWCRARERSFYLAFLHQAALAADGIAPFRQRVRDGGIIEYDECPTSHIELLEDTTYRYCTLHHHMETETWFQQAEEARRAARKGNFQEDGDPDRCLFITTLPWLPYTALLQPTGGDSNPRISWGRFQREADGRVRMPVSVLAHHGLVDGIHLAWFYRDLEDRLKAFCGGEERRDPDRPG